LRLLPLTSCRKSVLKKAATDMETDEITNLAAFFKGMTEFMSSSPVVVICLEGENAIKLNREIMGATDPKQAQEGTIRKIYGKSIDNANAVHGSDSAKAAEREIELFFKEEEIFS